MMHNWEFQREYGQFDDTKLILKRMSVVIRIFIQNSSSGVLSQFERITSHTEVCTDLLSLFEFIMTILVIMRLAAL